MRRELRGLIGAAVAAATVAVGVPGVASAADTWAVQPVPLPSGAAIGDMTGVSCTGPANCEAVMYYSQSLPAAEQWNGSTWTAQDLPRPGGDDDVYPESVSCSSATTCMAAGSADTNTTVLAYAALWNGSTWTYTDAQRTGTELSGVSCPSATHCMAVGEALPNDGGNNPFAEKWNGTGWKAEPVPAPPGGNSGALASVSCVAASDCIAVGETGLSGSPQILAYRWNGTSWTQQTPPAPAGASDPELTGVSCVSARNCTAVGDSNVGNDGGNTIFAEHWNGSTWAVQVLPLPGGTSASSLGSVSCVSARCTAVGGYFPATSTTYRGWHALADFFNGTRWSVQATATPRAHKLFRSISCTAARTCTAVGTAIATRNSLGDRPLAEQE